MKIPKKLNREAIGEDNISIEIYKSKDDGFLYYKDAKNQLVKIAGTSDLSGFAPITDATFLGTIALPSTTSIGNVSSTEIGYLDGVASAIQGQINAKVNLNTLITAGTGNRVTYDAKGLILSSENCNVQTVISSATVTPLVGNDVVRLTALAVGVTIANMVTPYDGKVLFIEIKDNATPQTVAFGTDYEWHITAVTTTTTNKWLTIGMIYNGSASKWHILSATTQP